LVAPISAAYRYQDMGLINDVQINGQITLTKPVTHNYDADNSIVGSALVIGDMFSRYTSKFVQGTWNSVWADEPTGQPITPNYNDALYPIEVTIKAQFRNVGHWYSLIFQLLELLVKYRVRLELAQQQMIVHRLIQLLASLTLL
jgi:hypothetical protein